LDGCWFPLVFASVVEGEGGVAGADAGDLAFEERLRRRFAGGEDGELDGGRSAVDDEQVQVASRFFQAYFLPHFFRLTFYPYFSKLTFYLS
jgi:hypothetical protein